MGIVRMGPPAELIQNLANRYRLLTFVETGTYLGETTSWAHQHFSSVITIENSKSLFDGARQKFEHFTNIKCLYGDSRSQLKTVVDSISSPAVFWLDSHWCGGDSYGETDQCPLLEELDILNSSHQEHLIFIDDARLFISPPPLPNRIEQWPGIVDVCKALDQGKFERYVAIFEDVVIAVPASMKDAVANWCQQENTKAWQAYGAQIRQTKIQRCYRHLSAATYLLTQGVNEQFQRTIRILADINK